MTLTPRDYRELLKASLPITSDADTLEINPRTLFTPAGHRASLEPDVTVVKGGRGVGKSVWFQALQDPQLRQIAADEYQLPQLQRIESHAGWGAQLSSEHYPSAPVLGKLLENGADPVDIWYAVILNALGVPEIEQLDNWPARTEWVRQDSERWEKALSRADKQAKDSGKVHLIMFDALDRMHIRRQTADKLATALLQVALDLRIMTRNLRAKVFIRHDMLDNLSLSFADSSKLISNAAELTWTRTNLYGLLFHYLGNADSEHVEAFRESTGTWASRPYRRLPPETLVGDRDAQHRWFVEIAGPHMGPNHRKGHTYTWLPNHLADGIGQVSPRSFLEALRLANENSAAQHADREYALHWDPIKQGVQAASRTRVRELTEDMGWVPIAFEPLRGKQVPIEQADVAERWRDADLPKKLEAHQQEQEQQEQQNNVSTGPRDHSTERLIQELIDLGVMTRRKNNMLDVPDIYRIHFDLGRKGGVPRVQSR